MNVTNSRGKVYGTSKPSSNHIFVDNNREVRKNSLVVLGALVVSPFVMEFVVKFLVEVFS